VGTDRAVERAADLAELGHQALRWRDVRRLAAAADHDPDGRVRAAALGALVRAGPRRTAGRAWRRALADPDAAVRRRAVELAPGLAGPRVARPIVARLGDPDPLVAEAAAASLGELGRRATDRGAVAALVNEVRTNDDALVREAAVAALGALGDPAGKDAVLEACNDRPAVRRRAVLALAAFSGPDVEAALEAARTDRDWQTRQAAEDLLGS
jgi:HEAT repeat protein